MSRGLQDERQLSQCHPNGKKAGLIRHGQPKAHLFELLKELAPFLRQIAPIGPVLPTHPANKLFALNNVCAQRYLDTIEVRSSSLLVPTIFPP